MIASIRPFRTGDERALLDVERRAAALLDAQGLHAPSAPADEASFQAFLGGHTIVVATCDGRPVGYAAGIDLGPLYWLRAIGVDPAHGRRGIGRALVQAVCDEGRALFHRAIGLTTYRHVPFNAPFYERCGFLAVSQQEIDATLAEWLERERPAGASPESRVAMVKWL